MSNLVAEATKAARVYKNPRCCGVLNDVYFCFECFFCRKEKQVTSLNWWDEPCSKWISNDILSSIWTCGGGLETLLKRTDIYGDLSQYSLYHKVG